METSVSEVCPNSGSVFELGTATELGDDELDTTEASEAEGEGVGGCDGDIAGKCGELVEGVLWGELFSAFEAEGMIDFALTVADEDCGGVEIDFGSVRDRVLW